MNETENKKLLKELMKIRPVSVYVQIFSQFIFNPTKIYR